VHAAVRENLIFKNILDFRLLVSFCYSFLFLISLVPSDYVAFRRG